MVDNQAQGRQMHALQWLLHDAVGCSLQSQEIFGKAITSHRACLPTCTPNTCQFAENNNCPEGWGPQNKLPVELIPALLLCSAAPRRPAALQLVMS